MATRVPAGRYISLSEYVRENGLSYQQTRIRLLHGIIRKRWYKVGRAWLILA